MDKFLAWMVDKNFVSVRSLMLYISVYMTMHSTLWAERYVEATKLTSGADLGLIIAAVTGPVTLFTGFVYKWYNEGRVVAQRPAVPGG